MMRKHTKEAVAIIVSLAVTITASAQNPFITNQFTADPSARVLGNRVYVFPSHDIKAPDGKNLRKDWFCMEDYHVFSSENLVDWTDHGVIVTQNKVPWVKPDSYAMWAPDAIECDGKYYFYFPATPKDSTIGRGFTIGVAIADKPEGPYIPEDRPIKGVRGIDPGVFIDKKDGQAYLYWSQGNLYGAKLKANMLELDSEVFTLKEFPTKGLKEGPYVFERNGIYYMTYPHVENSIERLEYATSDNPLGPFKFAGVIMDESPTGCWTNHQSIIQFKNQWYLFYHHNDLSPRFDKNRSVRVDSLFFNPDGTIKKVIPTLRGVGLSNAFKEIQIDRYSHIGGATIDFIDTLNTFGGWKTFFAKAGDWVQYNSVDFGNSKAKTAIIRVKAGADAVLQIATKQNGITAEAKLVKRSGWHDVEIPVKKASKDVNDLVITLTTGKDVEVDWIKFK
jgi:hypothetical protein